MTGWIILGIVIAVALGFWLGLVVAAWAQSKEEPHCGDLYLTEDNEIFADISDNLLKHAKKMHVIRLRVRIIKSSHNGRESQKEEYKDG